MSVEEKISNRGIEGDLSVAPDINFDPGVRFRISKLLNGRGPGRRMTPHVPRGFKPGGIFEEVKRGKFRYIEPDHKPDEPTVPDSQFLLSKGDMLAMNLTTRKGTEGNGPDNPPDWVAKPGKKK